MAHHYLLNSELLAAAPDATLAAVRKRLELTHDADKLILVLVGLPARGKSFIAHRLRAFLSWLGYRTQVRVPNARGS